MLAQSLHARGQKLKSVGDSNFFALIACARPKLTNVSDWVAARRGLRAGRCGPGWFALLTAAGFLVLGSRAASAPAAAITLALGAGALYLSQSSYWSVTADIAGPHAGVVSAVMNMGAQIGSAVTASLTPWLAMRFGWTAAFLAAAIFGVAGALAWFGVDPERKLGEAV